MNYLKNNRKDLIPYLIFLTVWCVIVLFDYKYGKTYLDSDMASEMVLANQLNKEGTLLSTNWYYSTEIRIFGNALLFKPLLKIFPDNWRLVRTIAQGILLLLTGISYVYMASILNKRRTSVIFATILICPFGFWNMWHGSFSGFYLIWIILFNFGAGLIFRLSYMQDKKILKIIRLIILIILSFLIGLQSVRGLMNLFVPLVLSSLLLLVMNLNEQKSLMPTSIKCFIFAVIASIFSMIGYLINSKVLSNIYSYENQNAQIWQDFRFNRVWETFESFVQLWGYPYNYTKSLNVELFSLNGILSVFGLVLTFIAIYVFVWLIKRTKKLDENNKIIALSALISTVFMFVVFVFIQKSSNINGSYFLPCLAFIIAGIQIMIENMNYSFKVSKIVVMTCFLVCVILSSINTCLLFLKNPPRSHENQVYIADLLMENGYEQCVGTFWNGGNVITELSNGKIESFVVSDLEYKQLNPWLQTKSHVKNYPSGKCALIIGTEECNELSYNPFSIDGVEVLHVDEELIVLGFEDIGIFFNK